MHPDPVKWYLLLGANQVNALNDFFQVVIHTFGFGITNVVNEKRDPRILLLSAIAEQKNESLPEEKRAFPGNFMKIESQHPETLRDFMTKFYAKPQYTSEKVTFTVPYYDTFGFGMVLSACLPVYDGNANFCGVTCIDMALQDIVGPLSDFPTEHMYAFMLDAHGRYVYHPLLPQPTAEDDSTVYLQFEALEQESQAIHRIKLPMLRGEQNKTTLITR